LIVQLFVALNHSYRTLATFNFIICRWFPITFCVVIKIIFPVSELIGKSQVPYNKYIQKKRKKNRKQNWFLNEHNIV